MREGRNGYEWGVSGKCWSETGSCDVYMVVYMCNVFVIDRVRGIFDVF